MDGPPALTLGLERSDLEVLMRNKPIDRAKSIVSRNMLLRIAFNGIFIGGILCAAYTTNFLGLKSAELKSGVFTLFVMFQLFNAFNSRELGSESIFKRIGNNKIMVVTFFAVFLLQIIIVQHAYSLFGLVPMSFSSWTKILVLSFSVIAVSELGKLFYRLFAFGKEKNVIFLKKNLRINKK